LDLLARFDPRITGTLPLGVSLPGSDIDILCHAPEPDDVADCLWQWRERLPALRLSRAPGEELRVMLSDMDLNDDAGREIKVELRRDLIAAIKRGDKSKTALLRQLVAALDNAEAVPLREKRASVDRHAFGDGSAEADRRVLSRDDVQALILPGDEGAGGGGRRVHAAG
jgi:hypothetical protein